VGKVAAGYQGWFSCLNDGSPAQNIWMYWSNDNALPANSNEQIHGWPDSREYTTLFHPAMSNSGNGQPASLYSSYMDQAVDTHFKWMKQYGVDVAALQRFNAIGNT
jgi:hypothetical protein